MKKRSSWWPALGMEEPSLQARLAAAALVAAALAMGWFAIWRLVLLRIPMIRGMCDLPPLDAAKKAS